MTEVNTQNSTGTENLEDRLKGWEREKRGILEDLKKERDQRHALEKEVEEIRTALNSAGNDTEIDPQSEVNRLAQKPREYILEAVRPELEARDQRIRQLEAEKKFDRAYQWLAKQEKKDVEDLYGSEIEKEIVRITQEHSMGMMDPIEGTKAAYKIFKQELREREEEEARRNQTISSNSTASVRTVPSTGGQSFTRDQIRNMSLDEFKKNEEAIQDAMRNGRVS